MIKQRIAVRVALTGILSALFVGLVALPASASGITGRADGGLSGPPVHPGSSGSSLDVVIAGLAGLLIVGFAGAVLWYVAKHRGSVRDF